MRSLVYVTSALGVVLACVCLAAPEPAIVPGPGQWTIDMVFTHPQQIVLQSSVENQSRRFWYTIITLTNNTDSDVEFYPKCDLMTDTFRIIPTGKGTTPAVFGHIKKRHQSRYPFLEPLEGVGNKILQGEDNARDVAIIWPDFDLQAKSIKVFITGLSNETVAVDHPVAKDETGKPLKVFLRKTLELSYDLRGDPSLRADSDLAYQGKRWIMR
jgi:hypothetical protein